MSKLHGLGWRHRIGLKEGIAGVYARGGQVRLGASPLGGRKQLCPERHSETEELAPHPGEQPLDKNGYRRYDGDAARRGRAPPPALARLAAAGPPFLVAAVCGTGAFVVSNFYMTPWYTTAETIWFPGTGNQGNGILSLIGGASADPIGQRPHPGRNVQFAAVRLRAEYGDHGAGQRALQGRGHGAAEPGRSAGT